MSASLVGSEMCIRDSYLQFYGDKDRAIQAEAKATKRPLCTVCGMSAVSYTHLTLPTICSV
eukprot:12161799-Alexandrium_andersonii.AAC.1